MSPPGGSGQTKIPIDPFLMRKQPIAGEEWKTDETGKKGEIPASVARKILDNNPRRFYGL